MSPKLTALALSIPLALASVPAMADCNGGSFAGFYLGSTLGVGSAHSKQISGDPKDPELSHRDTTFAGSSTAGYNIQCDSIVLGIEGEFGHLGAESNGTWVDPKGSPTLTDKIDWFFTLRGRIGAVVLPDTLVYVTGGFASADVKQKLEIAGTSFSQKDSGWLSGWTLGTGIEFLYSKNWVLRAEALYIDLGSEEREYNLTTLCGVNCVGRAKWEDDFWVARVGIAYKFGEETVDYKPLK